VQSDGDCLKDGGLMKREIMGKLVSDSRWNCYKLGEGAGAAVISTRNAEHLAAIAEVHLPSETAGAFSAINRRIESDAVARLKIAHLFADSFNNSGSLVAHHDGRNTAPGRAVITVNIAAADSTGGYANEKFVKAESWDRNISDLKVPVGG